MRPGLTRAEAAAALGIERHTMVRALAGSGLSFETLRSEARREALRALNHEGRVMSRKEMVAVLGFRTHRSFARWRVRIGKDVD